MEVLSLYRNFRMSAQKVREVVRQIQGLPALEAQQVLGFVSRKSARAVAKTLKSAIANAEHNHNLRAEALVVKLAVAESARSFRGMIPKARGSPGPIIKRNCHIRIVLSDNQG